MEISREEEKRMKSLKLFRTTLLGFVKIPFLTIMPR